MSTRHLNSIGNNRRIELGSRLVLCMHYAKLGPTASSELAYLWPHLPQYTGLLQRIRWSFEELGESVLIDGLVVRFFR